jgi:hypothetical protein
MRKYTQFYRLVPDSDYPGEFRHVQDYTRRGEPDSYESVTYEVHIRVEYGARYYRCYEVQS